jgi:uncharacterized protein DUF3631
MAKFGEKSAEKLELEAAMEQARANERREARAVAAQRIAGMTGQELLDRWVAWIRQWVVLTDGQAYTVALWAMHTWVYEHFAASPFLCIVASTKRSGKTTLLKICRALSRAGLEMPTVRVLSMAREIEAADGKISMFWDECEKLRHGTLDETRSVFAASYVRGAFHSANGERFRIYSPKAFALIGDVQDVLRDRSIVIDLMRGKPARSFTLNREAAEAQAVELSDEFMGWFAAHKIERIPIFDPEWLESSRDREIWSPIFSLAKLLSVNAATFDTIAGAAVDIANVKSGPMRSYHSSVDEESTEERMMSERCLLDLRKAFADGEAFLPSSVAVDRMRKDPYAPWRNWRQQGLSEQLLATLLDVHGVRPVVGQIGKGRKERTQVRGYKRADVFARKDL